MGSGRQTYPEAIENRDLVEVAAGVLGMLDVPGPADDPVPVRAVLPAPRSAPPPRPRPMEPWLGVVQAVLDLLPGHGALLTPVRDRTGRLTDLIYAACTPEATTPDGRRGAQLIGVRLAEQFPESVGSERWTVYERILETGEPAEVGPFLIGGSRLTVRVHRLGAALFVTWVGHGGDPGASDRIAGAAGRPLRVHGIVQDATARETSARRLAEVERQHAEHRRSLHAEHELAALLQQVILPVPECPVELPGVKVAVRYLPAGQESLVGGDWYHAAALRDGSVLLAIGDVAGHGTQAATTMAQLRYSLRALAVTTTDPAVLLGHLNRLTCDLDEERPETAATAIVARYEPALRRLTWAQAGHPPPLLSRGGRTRPLPRPTGPMLGVVEDAAYECAELRLAVGDVLLLYTDGLVEYRGRGMDEGLDAVIRTVDEAVAVSPLQPLPELVSRLQRANPDDDTCILAIRPTTGETQDLRRHLRGR
jgi:serine phosphatase RsbU (regulator of sigma subunit)